MDTYYLYKHTSPSGKVYIGQTKQTLKARWRSGKGYKNNPYFTKAIKKYGWDNFTHEVLFHGLSKELVNQLEQAYIAFYKEKGISYNITDGGEGTVGRKHTEEERKKMSEHKKGKLLGEENPFYGKHHSEESRKKMSECRKGRFAGKNHPMYGTKKELFDWLTPTGEIKKMDKINAKRWHPDWKLIGG